MYEQFYDLYVKNMVTKETLQKLAAANKLTQAEVDKIINERLQTYGY